MQLQETELFRASLREMVRELGMLSRKTIGTQLSPLQSHILIELDREVYGLGVTELAKKLCVEKSSISRTLKSLEQDQLIERKANTHDARATVFMLTIKGQTVLATINQYANQFTLEALMLSSETERKQLTTAILHFNKALNNARKQREMNVVIRPIEEQDNLAIAEVIRQSFIDNKIDHLEGISLHDPDLNRLSDVYAMQGSGYWVVEIEGNVIGGVGIAPLAGAPDPYVELQKLYIDRKFTGLGLGRRLIQLAIDQAIAFGYRYCYLETLEELSTAMGLYESYGFKLLDRPIGNTGHHACGICMLKDLTIH